MSIGLAVSDVPALAGLRFRQLRGADDAGALCAVRAGCIEHDQIDLYSTSEGVPSLEQARAVLAQAAAAGRQDQWLIVEANEHVIGYSRFESWHERDGVWVYLSLGWLLPSWRGRGIGTAMLHTMEERIVRAAAAEHPDATCEFAANASSSEAEATALLLHEGYDAGYTVLEMGLDPALPLPAPSSLPPGITIRPVLPEHYPLIAASIGESYSNEYAAGRFGDDYDPELYAADLKAPPNTPSLWQVAWDGNQVAGQALPVVRNGRAEVFEVSVRPAWRRRGLGRALLVRALHDLRRRNISIVRLHTVAEFPTQAWRLYESVGFRVLKRFPRYRKAFSWQRPTIAQ
jgi:mycothiol synthase